MCIKRVILKTGTLRIQRRLFKIYQDNLKKTIYDQDFFNKSMSLAINTTELFKYSQNKNNLLTYKQRKFYEDNGYLVVKKFVDDGLLDECRQRFIDVCNGTVPKGSMTLMKDISFLKQGGNGEHVYNKLQDILWDDVMEKYCMYPKILDYVESFVGPNIRAVHTMLINKPPDPKTLTSRHPLHQDLYYFPFRPENKIVAAWTAMEKVTTENGCLIVLPGSHKGELLEHDYPNWENGVNKAYHGVMGYDDYPTVPLPMEKGDTVFFHPLLIHGSGANLTKGFRKAISCHYAASECYYIDVTGTLQEKVALEIKALYNKRGFTDFDYSKAWQMRSRPVRGIELRSSL